jgi:radical SAM protein with 4Fe4S-binding SPASM domain
MQAGIMINCFAAHNSFWIDPQGHVRPCARYKEKMEHITSFDSFSEIVNSKGYIAIRNSHENNQWPTGCVRCKEDEEKNLHSKRQFYQDSGLQQPDDFMIDISMGNYCNLKCRMCGPNNSTAWNSDFKFLVDSKLFQDPGIDLSAYTLSNHDIDKLISLLTEVKGNIFIELKGGEPLIMPETEQLVNRLLALPNADRITLLIVTNGTVVPDWIEHVQLKIKKLQLVVSVDGIDDVYDYIRGTNKFKFKDCLKNIEYYHSLDNIELRFNVVVQNLNIHQMLEIHEVLNVKFNAPINYISLSMPKLLAINVMPKKSRHSIYQTFLKNKDKFGSYQNQMLNIHEILMSEPSAHLLEQFKVVTEALDNRRNQDINTVLPHLVNYNSN